MANAVQWFEILGPDSLGLQKFYSDTFGWQLTPPVKEMGNYSMFTKRPTTGIAGGIGEEQSPRVSIYIETPDPQALLEKAQRNGAQVLMPVTAITPTTTIAMLRDPAGNTFGLMKSNAPAKTTRNRATARRRTASSSQTTARKKTTARKSTARKKTTTRRRRR